MVSEANQSRELIVTQITGVGGGWVKSVGSVRFLRVGLAGGNRRLLTSARLFSRVRVTSDTSVSLSEVAGDT